jgi:hypothetical protein
MAIVLKEYFHLKAFVVFVPPWGTIVFAGKGV